MKKLLGIVIPVKGFSAMIFAGLMVLYMIGGALYAALWHVRFEYTIPFVFVLEGLALSVLISVLWGILFSENILKKWRYFPRLVVFSLSLVILLSLCLLVFFAMPTHEAKLWLLVAGSVATAIIALSAICELYFRATGKRYTELLQKYKADHS